MTVLIFIYAKLLYTREEAAQRLAISMRKIDELVANGELKPRRIDNSVRFYVGELIRFASKQGDRKCGQNAAGGADDHAA
jgi:excisionase family DNA binding protein